MLLTSPTSRQTTRKLFLVKVATTSSFPTTVVIALTRAVSIFIAYLILLGSAETLSLFVGLPTKTVSAAAKQNTMIQPHFMLRLPCYYSYYSSSSRLLNKVSIPSSTSLFFSSSSISADSSSSSSSSIAGSVAAVAAVSSVARSASNRRTLQPLVVCGPSGVGKGTIISRFMDIVNQKSNQEDPYTSSSKNRHAGDKQYHHLPEFKFSVSHTTRLPRSGEIQGVHYHFVSKEFMLSKIHGSSSSSDSKSDSLNNNFFVEYAQVHGNLYGTSFQSIYDASSSTSLSEAECTNFSDGDNEVLDRNRHAERVGLVKPPPSHNIRQRECLLDIDVEGVRSIKKFQLNQQQQYLKMMTTTTKQLQQIDQSNDDCKKKISIRLGKERSTEQYILVSPHTIAASHRSDDDIAEQLLLPLLDPKYIFITPPNIETLRERLSNRNTESPQSLELRMRNARDEMEYGMASGNFDAVIVNDNLERACQEFVEVVEGLYSRRTS